VKFIIDLDGPVLDPRKRLLRAYVGVTGTVGRQALAENVAYRLIRSGVPDGQLLRGAKPDELREFRRLFDEAAEQDENITLCEEQAHVGEALTRLKKTGELILVTTGSNRFARQLVLDKLDLSIHFSRMLALSPEANLRVSQLGELADGDDRVVVACASETLARSAHQAHMLPVAIANGACDDIRMTRVGAQLVFADLGELANDVEGGSSKLIQAGLLPPQHNAVRNPFLEPQHSSSGYRGRRGARNRMRR